MEQRCSPSEERKALCIPPKPELLVVVGAGGVLEFFTSRHMRIHVARKLTGLPNTIEAELAAEEYLELRLPQWAREIYNPENLQRQETIRLLRPSEEMDRRMRLALVRECKEIAEERRVKARQANGGESGVHEVPR